MEANTAKDLLPEIEIVIDGAKHAVKCTLGVLARYQLATGKDLLNDRDAQKFSPLDAIRFILCAIKKDVNPDTIAEYADKLDGSHLQEIGSILTAIFTAGASAVGKSEGESEKRAKS